MFRRALCFALSILTASTMLACGGGTGAKATTPTQAYKNIFAAVKAKDVEAVKRQLSKKTQELATIQSSRAGTPINAVYENGFTETTFANDLPALRDERVNGSMGALEVWNAKRSEWEDVPFILEDGVWKLAAGDTFFGNYKSPGPSREEREKEAANIARGQAVTPAGANSANSHVPTVTNPNLTPSPAKK